MAATLPLSHPIHKTFSLCLVKLFINIDQSHWFIFHSISISRHQMVYSFNQPHWFYCLRNTCLWGVKANLSLPFLLSFPGLSLFYLRRIYLFIWKSEGEGERDLSCSVSLLKWLQHLGLGQAEARSSDGLLVPHAFSGAQVPGPSSVAFPATVAWSWIKSGALTWDAGVASGNFIYYAKASALLSWIPKEDLRVKEVWPKGLSFLPSLPSLLVSLHSSVLPSHHLLLSIHARPRQTGSFFQWAWKLLFSICEFSPKSYYVEMRWDQGSFSGLFMGC